MHSTLAQASYFRSCSALSTATAGLLLAGGCALLPAGLHDEERRLALAGASYATGEIPGDLPTVPAEVGWSELLPRAFQANGDLEAAWHDWAEAVARARGEAAWPNTAIVPAASVLLGGEKRRAWDRATLEVGLDAMENLDWPSERRAAARAALAEARAASERFRMARFALQRAVIEGWIDLALAHELTRLERERLALHQLMAEAARARVEAGESSAMLADALAHRQRTHLLLTELMGREAAARAQLNVLVARPTAAPLAPTALPWDRRPLPTDDVLLLDLGSGSSPGLLARAHERDARASELEQAELAWLPDLDPFAALTGGEVSLGLGLVLPSTTQEIRGLIASSRQRLAAAEARLRQDAGQRQGALAATLARLRAAERNESMLERELLPALERVRELSESAYTNGGAELVTLLDTRLAELDARSALLETRAARERAAAELEELLGVDLETLEAGVNSTGEDASARGEVRHGE
jgi:outer membrane protein TolC